jgi:DNA-binding winged helix-turn-helix (wHTH) protein/tetratricopeptide (TPR) repeat protein
MSSPKSLSDHKIFHFGPYRLKTGEGVLEKDGVPLAIPQKTLEVLCVLVKSGGRLVEKQTLMEEVWTGTFVEDSNIAFQISTLRKLLEENAASPKFIATVPKRGYRFIAEVVEEFEAPAATAIPDAGHPPAATAIPWFRIGGVAIAVLLGLGWMILPRPRAKSLGVLPQKGALVLADFDNRTGDPVFDGMLRQGLLVELEQSPSLALLPEHRLRRTLALMQQPPTARLTHDVSMDICRRTGSALLIEGSIERFGGIYVLALRALNCDTGSLVDAEQAKAQTKEHVLDALSTMAARFRSRVGEAAESVSLHNTSLAEATTPSIDALQAYSTAWTLQATRGVAEAIPLLRRAVELDPKFALAQSALGRMYADLDQSDMAAESLRKAWDLKEHASDRERFFIAFNYHALVTGNLEEARKVAKSWSQTYPREAVPHTFLSGLPNKAVARFDEAASEARTAIELDPDFGMSYYNLAVNNLYLQRIDEASNSLKAAAQRGLDLEEFHMLAYDLAFLHRDAAGMDEIVKEMRHRSGRLSWLTNREAFRAAYMGHIRLAREQTAKAVFEAEQANESERAGLWEAGAALREAMTGGLPEARKTAASALRRTNDREVDYGAGLALALAGDLPGSQTIVEQLEKKFPEDTSVRFAYVPVIRAAIELARHKPGDALEALSPTTPAEFGVYRSPINTLYGALYPVYFRGLALSEQGRDSEATIEFQKIIDHSGIVGSDIVGALANLQLARSYQRLGQNEKAITAYRNFFDLWKKADPEIPLIREAQTGFNHLMAGSARY